MAKLILQNLAIEITRKCNFKCKHCLRGKQQDYILTLDALDNLKKLKNYFEELYIGTIILSGGEPGYAIDECWKLLNWIKENNITYGNIYIVTNGTVNLKKLLTVYFAFGLGATDNELSGFRISNTQFHSIQRKKLKLNIDTDVYPYDNLIKNFDFNKHEEINIDHLIPQGNAVKYFDLKETNPTGYIEIYDDEITIEELYLTYDGKFIFTCNMSYKNIDIYKISVDKLINGINKILKQMKDSKIDYADFTIIYEYGKVKYSHEF